MFNLTLFGVRFQPSTFGFYSFRKAFNAVINNVDNFNLDVCGNVTIANKLFHGLLESVLDGRKEVGSFNVITAVG